MVTPSLSPDLRFFGRRRLPIILQTEAAECGLACLAMIATYWGLSMDVPAMRRRFSVSLRGVTMKTLVHMADALGLQSRPLKLDMQSLGNLKLPCILHWDMNHFVVLRHVGPGAAVVHDPGAGERRVSWAELASHFTGVALELLPGAEFKPAASDPRISIRALMGPVVGLRRGVIQLLLLGLAMQVCVLVAPFYLQWTVDEALVAADRDLITVLGIGFVGLMAVQASIGAVRSWVTTMLSTDLNFQWLGNSFAHLMRLPLAYFEKRHLGDIVSRFNSIQSIQKALTSQFVEGLIDGVLVLFTAVVMLLYSPRLTLVASGAAAAYTLLRLSLFRSLKDASSKQIVKAAIQQTHFLESTRGVQSLRLFGRIHERRIGWMNHLADQFNAELRIARLSISHQTGSSLIFGFERIAVIWLGAIAVMDTQLSVGMLFAFLSYKDQFSQRVAALIDKLFELRMLRLHADRVADIALTEPEATVHTDEVDVRSLVPEVEFRKVSFRYSEGEPYVIKDLDLRIPAGQCVAIAGASGCGKTTLVKLLLGLLRPTSGEILVGGVKIDAVGLDSYRTIVGTVMQEDQLFSGSLSENISFFDTLPDKDRIERCAQYAAIHKEIQAMPMGYNTRVGDIGMGLSGGQRQRILLARALYRNPRLLVLDEATSHLDVANEQLVNATVRHFPLTRVIVAHRPETLAMAQRVIVLQGGEIIRDLEQPSPSRANEPTTLSI